MRAYYEGDGVQLFLGDCRHVMEQMEPESVSCVVTSPPFYGLRKYTCEPSIWGGDTNCPHTLEAQPVDGESYASRERWQHDGVSREETPAAWVKEKVGRTDDPFTGSTMQGKPTSQAAQRFEAETATCSLCGAWRGQLGLEPTVEMYVAHTIDWLRAVKKVLRKDGVVWLDIDDSRNNPTHDQKSYRRDRARVNVRRPPQTIPAKNLCLIPQRIAIAAQDDGWIVRSEIIITSWMPESAQDRPTDACRKVLMLTRSPRYWYDGQAVRVRGSDNTHSRAAAGQMSAAPCESEAAVEQRGRLGVFTDGRNYDYQPGDLRNLGSVWTDIPPAAYPDAHFATFAVEEPERCIKASCPEGGLVLDPFIGTGTTAIAARKLGRRCIGIDASEDYLQQAVTRLTVGDSGIRRLVEARKQGSEQLTLFCDSGPTGPEGG